METEVEDVYKFYVTREIKFFKFQYYFRLLDFIFFQSPTPNLRCGLVNINWTICQHLFCMSDVILAKQRLNMVSLCFFIN